MRSMRHKFAATLALASVGTVFQSCGIANVASFVANQNPCGVIFVCNPQLYDFARSGIDGPGVNIEADPFCTFAPFCTADVDPIFGGLGIPNP